MTFTKINDTTGFATGDEFTSDEQVREYFTIESMRDMFGGVWHDDDNQPARGDDNGTIHVSQNTLDTMAATVIENRWHYASEEK
jgi:hypothetical protein